MLTNDELLAAMRHEVKIIQHLAGKLTDAQVAYRPTDGQRSMEEFLRYLTTCAYLPAVGTVNGNWDHVDALNAEAADVTLATFSEAMERQMTRCEELIGGFSDEDLASRDATLPWGEPLKLGAALVRVCLLSLTAYRMQLFLWSKESGNADLSTFDCWVGMDRPTPPPIHVESSDG